jgi:hypothetical protein
MHCAFGSAPEFFESNRNVEKVTNHYKNLTNFVIRTCDAEAEPEIAYMRDCVCCLTDWTQIFPRVTFFFYPNRPTPLTQTGITRSAES